MPRGAAQQRLASNITTQHYKPRILITSSASQQQPQQQQFSTLPCPTFESEIPSRLNSYLDEVVPNWAEGFEDLLDVVDCTPDLATKGTRPTLGRPLVLFLL